MNRNRIYLVLALLFLLLGAIFTRIAFDVGLPPSTPKFIGLKHMSCTGGNSPMQYCEEDVPLQLLFHLTWWLPVGAALLAASTVFFIAFFVTLRRSERQQPHD